MKCIINNTKYLIKEVEQKDFINHDSHNKDDGYFFGQTHFDIQEIWLCKTLSNEKKRKTLIHELTHVYIKEYLTTQEIEPNEEVLCDIHANSHDMIHSIVEKYFNIIDK